MKKLALICTLLLSLQSSLFALTVDSITYSTFGKIIIYHPAKFPTSVALFVSGDGGWKNGVINMAKDIANQGALVLGIDAKTYKNALSRSSAECYYPAADFERLSLMIQKKYKFSSYTKPVLVGYSYGATLIYGILAQAPANTFKGALALGFCPDIELKKPLCAGNGLTQHVLKPGISFWLERTDGLTAPFIVLNGFKDQTCPYAATETFLKGMPMTELVPLPKVGHGFSIADHWLPAFNTAYAKILASQSFAARKEAENVELKKLTIQKYSDNLPLAIIPAKKKSNLPLFFMISGDGGWTSFDQSLAEALAANGVPVIGLDAQKYFWSAKTPDQTTEELSKAIAHYMGQFDKDKMVLAGYSFGASVVPFLATRLPAALKSALTGILAISPDVKADFEIHIADMLNFGGSKGAYNVVAEIKKIKSVPMVNFFGKGEGNSVAGKFSKEGLKVVILPGNHHFGNNFSLVADALITHIDK